MKIKSIAAGRAFSITPDELRAMAPELERMNRTLLYNNGGTVWHEAEVRGGEFYQRMTRARVPDLTPRLKCMLVYPDVNARHTNIRRTA